MAKLTRKARVEEIFKAFSKDNPEPKGELKYTNTYTLLVAVALSAQATDIGVNKATDELFKVIETPQDTINLGLDELKEYIKTIGLYNTKAVNIIKCAERLLEKHNGIVPNDQKALEKLAGVGQKTANVVRNEAFGEHTIAVDTHLFRLSNRLRIALGKTPEEVERKLLKIIPKQYLYYAHHWLILHGRYVCKARRPLCRQCIIQNFCPSIDLNYTLPNK